MNILTNRGFSRVMKAAFAVVVMMSATTSAFAATSASHVIRNTVQVDYQDPGGNTYDSTDFVDVTTQLVATAPAVVFDAANSDSLNPVSPGETVNLLYTVTSDANGVDQYNTAISVTQLTTTGTSTTGTGTGPFGGNIVLGGSNAAAAYASGDFETGDVAATNGTLILVPADNDGTDDNENGFEVGDIIVLTGTGEIVCQVNAIVDSGSADPATQANATATIEVDRCGDNALDAGSVSFSLAIGDQLGERVTANFTVTPDAGADSGTLDAETTYTSNTDGGQSTTDNQTITVVAADLQIYKFVRNVSGGTTGNDAADCNANDSGNANNSFECVDIGGTLYYDSGVTAAPGEQLEYVVLLYNNAGTVQNVVVTDPVVAFTTYEATSIQIITQTVADDTTGAGGSGACLANASNSNTCFVDGSLSASNGSDAVDGGDFGGITGGNVLTISGGYDSGSGTTTPASETVGGTIDPGSVSVVRYLINVD